VKYGAYYYCQRILRMDVGGSGCGLLKKTDLGFVKIEKGK
jgi:hypothetical protein